MYFISKNGKVEGPLTLGQIKNINLDKDTLVWKEGFNDWVKASNIEELKDYIVSKPPPLPEEQIKYENKILLVSIVKNSISYVFILTIVFELILFYGAFFNTNTDLDNLFPVFLSKAERNNPFLYLINNLFSSFLISFILVMAYVAISYFKNKRNLEDYYKTLDSNDDDYMSDYGAIIKLTKENKTEFNSIDKDLIIVEIEKIKKEKKYFNSNGEEFIYEVTEFEGDSNEIIIILSEYWYNDNYNEIIFSKAKENDLQNAEEIKKILETTLMNEYQLTMVFEKWY
jgi:hypothetical protein